MELGVTGPDRFELLVPINRGATGHVYEGRDRSDPSGEICHIKVIEPELADGTRFATILNAEAPQAVAFRHENAARTLYAGKCGEHTIIATERLRGYTLDAWMQRAAATSRALPWEVVAWVGLQVVQALRAAHQTPWADGESKGMYHCSISPHSIFLLPDGQVRLLGVGLGRSRMCLPPSREKLPYRAPELFERQKPDDLTDIYSLGVTLHDAISGSRFFGRASVAEIKDAILGENPPPLRLERPDVTPAIDELLDGMISKFPRTRPSLRKVEEVLSTLSRRSSFSSRALAGALQELFGAHRPDRASRPVVPRSASKPVEEPSDFYPDYDIDDLVAKVIASKHAEPMPPMIDPSALTPLPPDEILEDTDPPAPANPFDVDAAVNAIVTSARTADVLKTPPPRTPPPRAPSRSAQPRATTPPPRAINLSDEQLYAGALSSLEDAEGSFDVDAIVNAIVSNAPQPTPPRMPAVSEVDTQPSVAGRLEITPTEVRATADVLTVADTFKPGDVIGDRYRVIDELGEGGMSVVYKVEHTLLLKRMALKLLRPELSSMPSVVERFQLEARSVCQLDDPNIVRVTDFGRQPNGALYLVMDYLEGESLASRLRRERQLAPDVAIDITLQILSGLAHAHHFGVVHRDLKPENIMLVPKFDRIQVKILDFGIAKLASREDEESAKPITQAGTVFGTPRYMSPEQAAAEPVDLRADIYAVGVILYELLTGRVPFDGSSAVRILSKVLTEEPPPLNLTEPNPKVGAEIEVLVMRALQKEKEDRFPTASAFRAALLKAIGK